MAILSQLISVYVGIDRYLDHSTLEYTKIDHIYLSFAFFMSAIIFIAS